MNPLHKASVRRKIVYFAAILAIFTVSIFYRGVEAKTPAGDSYVWVPFGRDDRAAGAAPTALNRAGDWLARKTILSQARRTELRELEQGDPELAGSAMRLAMLGSRGFAVTALWIAAIDKQKRNDFHEFEQLVKAVTKLQPNFITPWIFQSWNITYNVSVEQDKLNDMYFYIARGIELLAEGERRNRRSPDMRYQIAFYYQNKFGVSDKVRTLRCLFQLSCMRPAERDPDALINPADKTVDVAAFRAFCEKNPHLVRRLREQLNCHTPKDVLDFLRDNKSVRSRYKNATELADAAAQFPVLPPRFQETQDEISPADEMTDANSAYQVARAWFSSSLTLLPPAATFPPGDEFAGAPMPAPSPAAGEYDPFKYRVPRLPMLIIFRQGAPRAQSYQAEMEQKEGWFDRDGWRLGWPANWRDRPATAPADAAWKKAAEFWWPITGGDRQWFPGQDVVIGKDRPWSRMEWEKAAEHWTRHGEAYGLSMPTERFVALKAIAGDANNLPPDPTPEQQQDPVLMRRYRAVAALYFYQLHRGLTNFPAFQSTAQAEAQEKTVEARKILWQAAQAQQAGNKLQAIALYRDGLARWKGVLGDNPNFHRNDRTEKAEEETYEYELEYLRLIAADDLAVRRKAQEEYEKAAAGVIPYAPVWATVPPTVREDLSADAAEKFFSPFDGFARDGLPWVRSDTKDMVRTRSGGKVLTPQPTPTFPATGPGPG